MQFRIEETSLGQSISAPPGNIWLLADILGCPNLGKRQAFSEIKNIAK